MLDPKEVGGLVKGIRLKAAVLETRGKNNTLHDVCQSADYLREAANALEAQAEELAAVKAEVARYWTSADMKPWCDLAEEKGLGHFGKKLKGMFSRAVKAEDEARTEFDRAERAEAALAEAKRDRDEAKTKANYWQAEYLNACRDASSFSDDLVAAKAQRDEALKALEPFAAVASEWDGQPPALSIALEWNDGGNPAPSLLVTDFRAARRALTGGQEDG